MRSTSRQKEIYGKTKQSPGNFNEGTAARTRPFNFDEIMARRKDKKLSENVKVGVGASEPVNISTVGIVENVSSHYRSETDNGGVKGSSLTHEKPLLEEFVEAGFREKDKQKFTKDDSSTRRKHRGDYDSETKSMSKMIKDVSNKAKEVTDKTIHGRGRFDNPLSDKETAKKRSRDVNKKDGHADKNRGESERGSKRNYPNGGNEKHRERIAPKKHDRETKQESEISERRERKELSKVYNEELRLKRRRSKSREREGRKRRSVSHSPKSRKHTSHQRLEHGEMSTHSFKDRSGQKHSDVDRRRVTSNGLTSYHRRHGGSSSGLGGYSPRKRRSEAAMKTPSPIHHSPEKKAGKSTGTGTSVPGSVASDLQASNQTISSNILEVTSTVPIASTSTKLLSAVSPSVLSNKESGPIDSIQLTQATRPMRRLYVENIPASASEKAVMECFNNLLCTSGVNYIEGAQPCISCAIHKEKGQALLEFLTPENASAALSFDGTSFAGSILKIRRPKDFVEVTGEQGKSMAAIDLVSDVVKDSPHKIFIGGISKSVSPKMLMEIVSAFGRLKAYHFEVVKDLNEACAFLEYVDKSVTLKACAGLNGMKLGGRVITAVRAISDASALETSGDLPFYGIPGHAKPLLEQPTPVLKLKNVLNSEALSSLSELELEEVIEDVRLECARFGTVKSVNVVKLHEGCMLMSEACKINDKTECDESQQILGNEETDLKGGSSEEAIDQFSGGNSGAESLDGTRGMLEVDEVLESSGINHERPDRMEDVPCEPGGLDHDIDVEALAGKSTLGSFAQEALLQPNTPREESDLRDNEVSVGMEGGNSGVETKLVIREEGTRENDSVDVSEASGKFDNDDQDRSSLERMFEPGGVFVEYGRTEASCTAAHSLYGRLFDDRIVTVEYVPHHLYRARFPK
ncbi:splicing factor U2af large subunit A-like isoform X2 [Tripterygium wilfordii]|uniref:splicing factor U2af large subunit A isoform X2 n=1 Tax=Tripterygium wilfordii TaxID=458696 RepID=UPI0018F7E74D|nr:splicing factor U2af large subunit A isoform X2 [Tripterygium wilfordii]XP_038723223.1 splicing factor U2af large subunit A-like isoform X2 [Tripterygium wilfordii]